MPHKSTAALRDALAEALLAFIEDTYPADAAGPFHAWINFDDLSVSDSPDGSTPGRWFLETVPDHTFDACLETAGRWFDPRIR